MDSSNSDHEKMAAALEISGQYKVLRKLEALGILERPNGVPVKTGILLDVETTGLDLARDQIIELSMVPFTYGVDGKIFEVHPPFQSFNEPSVAIPPEVTELTGITDEMVRGHKIDIMKVIGFLAGASLIVAHNARFDRRFAERACRHFESLPWACSMTQVDWKSEGYDGSKLSYLLMSAGYFYERHRAANDCIAAIKMLSMPLPKSKVPAMAQLLEAARRPSWRIWAENAPFDFKDFLKARGYRWNGDGNPRAWYIDVEDEGLQSELEYLRREIYRREVDPPAKKITAFERFSVRA